MSRYLLDVNVLIALIDANHVHHDRAHQWFAAEGVHAWATCATTENGLLRIVGNPRYRPIKLIKTYLLYNNSVLCLLPASTRLPRGIRLVLAVKRLKMRGFTALSQHHTPLGLTFFPQALRLAELAIGIDAINSINTLLK